MFQNQEMFENNNTYIHSDKKSRNVSHLW